MIENLKDLERLLKLCRKQGVTKLTLGAVSLELGDLPLKQTTTEELSDEEIEERVYESMPDRVLTPEELTFLANGGLPADLEKELQ